MSRATKPLLQLRVVAGFPYGTVGVACAVPDGRFLAVNPPFCKLASRTGPELAGMSLVDVVHSDDRQAYLDPPKKKMRGGKAGVSPVETRRRFVAEGRDPIWDTDVSAAADELGEVRYLLVFSETAGGGRAERSAVRLPARAS
jgi:PAS domain-containing protein